MLTQSVHFTMFACWLEKSLEKLHLSLCAWLCDQLAYLICDPDLSVIYYIPHTDTVNQPDLYCHYQIKANRKRMIKSLWFCVIGNIASVNKRILTSCINSCRVTSKHINWRHSRYVFYFHILDAVLVKRLHIQALFFMLLSCTFCTDTV